METIKIDALCKAYGNVQAINNVSLSVKRGEVFIRLKRKRAYNFFDLSFYG